MFWKESVTLQPLIFGGEPYYVHVLGFAQHLLDRISEDAILSAAAAADVPADPVLCRKGYELSGSDVLDGSIIRYEREMA